MASPCCKGDLVNAAQPQSHFRQDQSQQDAARWVSRTPEVVPGLWGRLQALQPVNAKSSARTTYMEPDLTWYFLKMEYCYSSPCHRDFCAFLKKKYGLILHHTCTYCTQIIAPFFLQQCFKEPNSIMWLLGYFSLETKQAQIHVYKEVCFTNCRKSVAF